jgi:hypothetical protein
MVSFFSKLFIHGFSQHSRLHWSRLYTYLKIQRDSQYIRVYEHLDSCSVGGNSVFRPSLWFICNQVAGALTVEIIFVIILLCCHSSVSCYEWANEIRWLDTVWLSTEEGWQLPPIYLPAVWDTCTRVPPTLCHPPPGLSQTYWSRLVCTIFSDITPCSPLKVNRRFGGTYRLHLQSRIRA